MGDSAARVRAGARRVRQIKDAGRSECWAIREPADADMRRPGGSSARAGVVESPIPVRRKYAPGRMAAVAQEPLQETVHALAAIERGSATEGEREAAEWVAERLRRAGLEPIVEEEQVLGRGFWWPLGVMSAGAALAGFAALRGRRLIGAAVGLAAGAGIAEDLENGPRVYRRLAVPRRKTWNVTAVAGDPDAERTAV